MQVLIIDSAEALKAGTFTLKELNLIREWYDCVKDCNPKYLQAKDSALVDKVRAVIKSGPLCLHPIEVPSDADSLAKKVANEVLCMRDTEAAALITAHSRTVPRAMLQEVAENGQWNGMYDSVEQMQDTIATKYGYHAE